MPLRLPLFLLFFIALAASADSLHVGPPVELAPIQIGASSTVDRLMTVVPLEDDFLVGFTADLLPFASDSSEIPVPSPLGSAVGAASDGHHVLTLEYDRDFDAETAQWTGQLRATWLDERGQAIRTALEVSGTMLVSERSVVWTGRDFIVVWSDYQTSTVRAARIGSDGTLVSGPFTVANGVSIIREPFIAAGPSGVIIAVVFGDDSLKLFRVGPDDETALVHVISPRAFRTIVDFVAAGDSYVLLVREESDEERAIDARLYFLDSEARTLTVVTDGVANGDRPVQLLALPDRVLLYGGEPHGVTGKVFSLTGVALSDRRLLVNGYVHGSFVRAARRDDSILFVLDRLGLFAATLDASLAQAPAEARTVLRSASKRWRTVVATAESTSLTVWIEQTNQRRWVAGTLRRPDGSLVTLELASGPIIGRRASVATDGVDYFVTWSRFDDGATSSAARVVRSDGTMTQIMHGVSDGFQPVVEWTGDSYVMVWSSPLPEIRARLFDRGGLPRNESKKIDASEAYEPAMARSGDRILIAWTTGDDNPFRPQTSGVREIQARAFSTTLEPLTPAFTIANDLSAYEIEPAVAGSDHGWLVAWASTRSVLPGDVGLPHKQGEIGHASVSPHGFVQALRVPELPVRNIRWKRRPAITWTGRNYLLVWDDESTIFGARISANGERIDREDIAMSDGFAPALAGKSGGTVLAYSVVQPERGIGAAPQAYQREVSGGLSRRRVAGRR